MKIENIKLLFLLSGIVIAIIAAVVAYLIINSLAVSEERRKVRNALYKLENNTYETLEKSHIFKKYINSIALMLSKNGANYMFKKRINPYVYIGGCMASGIVSGIVISNFFGNIIGLIAGIVIAFLPRLLLIQSNKNDNEKMLRDITTVYDSLVVQTSAGMFLSKAIQEASSGVKFKRLKAAFMEMNLNVELQRMNLDEALDDFQSKFNNQHLDMLVLVLKQSLKSGQASQYLRDLQDQMNDVQHAIENIEQERTDFKLQIVEFLIYVSIMIFVLAMLAYEFVSNFNNI